VIWDEIDKASDERRNGALAEGILPFLESSTSRRMLDLALEVHVDLSHVSHLLTANRLEDVPAALRDRCRVLRVPLPTVRHLHALVPGILDDIRDDRGLGRDAWIQPLAADELDVVRQAWGGGSLRRLRRIVATAVDARERLAPRH
jgi:hypothetical protein